MNVDGIEHSDARDKIAEMQLVNHKHMWLATLPHKIGVTGFVAVAVFSPFIVWHANTAIWFQENFVAGPNISTTNDMAVPDAEVSRCSAPTFFYKLLFL